MSEKYWDRAWSLVDGCTPVSAACDNCWLAAIAFRFGKSGRAMKITGTVTEGKKTVSSPSQCRFTGHIQTREDRLDLPLKTRKPTVWAVWSDLFHEQVPDDFIDRAHDVMGNCQQHTFLVLTKRPQRLMEYMIISDYFESGICTAPHIWHGTTVEDQDRADERIPRLLTIPGRRFLSVEPILGPLEIRKYLNGFGTECSPRWCKHGFIDWVIVGAESGPHRRPARLQWIESVVTQCQAAGVPVFVKQIHDAHGRLVKDISQFPAHLRIRQKPWETPGA